MEYEEEIQKLRAELLDLERTYKKLSLKVSAKRLDKVNKRLEVILDAHRKNLDVVQANLQNEIDTKQLCDFTDSNRAVTRLQIKFLEVETLVASFHSPDVDE